MSDKQMVGRLALSVLAVFLACSPEKKSDPSEPTPWDIYVSTHRRASPSMTTSPSSAAVSTGDTDHDFLRAMSNHNKNVIVLTDAALERNNLSNVEDMIRQLEERHGHDLDTITAILRNTYKDRYVSQPNPKTRSIVEVLRRAESDQHRIFLDAAIEAEQDASRIVDTYLPMAKRADVKRLAAKMKADQTSDIVVMKQRLAARENPQ